MNKNPIPGEGTESSNEKLNLKKRTLDFSVRIVRLFEVLQKSTTGYVIGKQLLRSGTAVGAMYRESCRSRSDAEFISKMENALQELEETAYWLELVVATEILPTNRLESLQDEVDQLIAIFTTCVKKVKQR
jgi:four helix bundle protein